MRQAARLPKAPPLGALPKISGVIWQWRKKQGYIAVWVASRRARECGFEPKTVRLHGDVAEILTRAMTLESQVASWLKNYLEPRPLRYAGRHRDVIDDMLDLYQDHDASNFSQLSETTRRTYRWALDYLRKHIGRERVSRATKLDVDRWYRAFRKPSEIGGRERVAQAHLLMTMLRTASAFCTGLYPSADKLSTILSSMRFDNQPPRTAFLTAEMVIAFRREAHKAGLPSLALATAIQFETALRQGDVIGKWVPDMSGGQVMLRSRRYSLRDHVWRDGLEWEKHISSKLILEKPTNKTRGQKTAMSDLNMCEMVVEELAHVPTERRTGPVILCEWSNMPWVASQFQHEWRKIATRAGIPKSVRNMDARAGAVTEGSDADAPDEHLRLFATHANFKTTRRYNRTTLHKSQTVHAARTELRQARMRAGRITEHSPSRLIEHQD